MQHWFREVFTNVNQIWAENWQTNRDHLDNMQNMYKREVSTDVFQIWTGNWQTRIFKLLTRETYLLMFTKYVPKIGKP